MTSVYHVRYGHGWRSRSKVGEEEPVTVKDKIQAELDAITRDMSETRADFAEDFDLLRTVMDLHDISTRLNSVVKDLTRISSEALEELLAKEASDDPS